MTAERQEDEHGNQGGRLFDEGKYVEAASSFEKAWMIARERGDTYAESIWLANLGTAYLACHRDSEATKCFEAGLQLVTLLGRHTDELHFHRDLVAALSGDDQLAAAVKHGTTGLELAVKIGDRKEEQLLWGYLGNRYSIAGMYAKAQDCYQRAMQIAEELHDEGGVALWTGNIGNNLLGRGEYGEAFEHFQRAVKLSEQVGDRVNIEKWRLGLETARRSLALQEEPEAMARKAYESATRSHAGAAPERAIMNWLEAAKWCRLARDYRHCGDGLCNAGVLLNQTGQYDEADRRFKEALDAYKQTDDRVRTGTVHVNQGVSFRDRGNREQAEKSIEVGIAILRSAGAELMLANAIVLLSDIRTEQGRDDEAVALLRNATELYRRAQEKPGLADALIRLGTKLRFASPESAESLLRESVALSREVNAFKSVAIAVMALATTLTDQGKSDAAVRELQTSKAQVVAEGPSEIACEYLLLLASLLKQQSRAGDAMEIWHEALELAEDKGELVAVARALGEIAIQHALRLRSVRRTMRSRMQAGVERPESAASSIDESGAKKIETEDDAIALMTALSRTKSQDELLKILHASSAEVNEVFFASLVFNVQRCVETGDRENAKGVIDVARMIAQAQRQSLRILSTLSTQLFDQDQTKIIHLEPGAEVKVCQGDNEFNRRAADVLSEDGIRLGGAQQFRPAYARFKNELQFRESLGDAKSTGECLGNLARIAEELGEVEAALEFGRRALDIFQQLGNTGRVAQMLLSLGTAEQKREQLSEALDYYRRALEVATLAGDKEIEALAVANIGTIYQVQGRKDEALEWQERALALKRHRPDRRALVSTLCNLAGLYRDTGEEEKAVKATEEARAIIESSGDNRRLAMFLNNQAADSIRRHGFEVAEALLHEAKALASELADPFLSLLILENQTVTFRSVGKWRELSAALDEATAIVEKIGSPSKQKRLLMLRADAAAAQGALPTAVREYEQVLAKHSADLSAIERISVLHNMWDMCSKIGDIDRAIQYRTLLEQVITGVVEGPEAAGPVFILAARALGGLAIQGQADLERANSFLERAIKRTAGSVKAEDLEELYEQQASIFRALGRLDAAIEAHQRALQLAERRNNARQRAVILANLATVLREKGWLNEAANAFQEALNLARSLGWFGLQAQILMKATTVEMDLGRRDQALLFARESVQTSSRLGDQETEARARILIASTTLKGKADAAAAEAEIRAVLNLSGLSADNRADALAIVALCLRSQHRLDEAAAAVEQGISLLSAPRTESAALFLYAGLIYRESGKKDVALDRLANGLGRVNDSVASPLRVNMLEARGDIYFDDGDYKAATVEYRAALECLNGFRRHVAFEEDRLGLNVNWGGIPEKLADALLHQGNNAEAFEALEAAKSRSFLERLGLGDLPTPQTVPDALRQEEQQASEQVRRLEIRLGTAGAGGEGQRLTYLYRQAVIAHNRVLDEIARFAPDYVEWRRGKTATLDEIRALL